MYEMYWGLAQKPFDNTPDPRFFFASAQHQEACARVLYCIRERKGAGMLTGVFGCGKTVVGQVVLQELNQERYRTAVIANPRLSDVDLLRMIAHGLGVAAPPSSKADILMVLQAVMSDNAREGRDTVVVVDEAHAIGDPNVFEELRLLLNFQRSDQFLITLLLFGQPELTPLINQNKPFEQRIGIKSHLGPLTQEETYAYIRHRLAVAGHRQPHTVFTTEAVGVVFESTGGIPRRINRLCDISLVAGMSAQVSAIDAGIVAEEVKSVTTVA